MMDLLSQAKRHLIHFQEIGFDAPTLSPYSLQYLREGIQLDVKAAQETFYCNSLAELEKFIGNCDKCKLSNVKKNIVVGEGSPNAQLVFVGEAPGMDEDVTGRPFVGKAGKLLTDIIKAMGLTREEVYLCNIVKCHPPHNRDPERDEIQMCLPFLKAQLSLIKPGIICAISFMGIPLMPTYHPAYLLRYPQAKKFVWEDMQKIMNKLGLTDPRE